MARLSKHCPACKMTRRVTLQLVPAGETYAFQAQCVACGTIISADGPPLRTADEIAAWVDEHRNVTP